MGMTREEAIEILRNLLKELTEDFDALTEEEHEAYDLAIETMCKYQKIEQIIEVWHQDIYAKDFECIAEVAEVVEDED